MGLWGRGGKRGLRIWGIKLRRNIQQLPAGITRVSEMTAPRGSCYQAGLLIGRLDCREKRLVQSTVVWSHIIYEKRCRQKAVSPALDALEAARLALQCSPQRGLRDHCVFLVHPSPLGFSSLLESPSAIKSCSCPATGAQLYIWLLRFLEKYLSK